MKQILIKKTDLIKQKAGSKFSLLLTSKSLPNMILSPKDIIKMTIPLDLEVLSGGEDWNMFFSLSPVLAENGVVLLSSERKGKDVQVIVMNLTGTELYLEEGFPIVEVTLAQLVLFRQVEQSGATSFGTDGVVRIVANQEERKSEAQIKNAKKKKKKES